LSDGRHFFSPSDPGWKLFQSTTRAEASYHPHIRARQRSTVVRSTVISEYELTDATALGQTPSLNIARATPNENYFDRVAEITEESSENGLYRCLLPVCGGLRTPPWGQRLTKFTLAGRKQNIAHQN